MSGRLSRADSLINNSKRSEFNSDFLTSFAISPVGNQLGRVVNDKSIMQSLKNIISTDIGERLFQPSIGSDVRRMLFENIAEDNLTMVSSYIQTAILRNEPRVSLIKIDVSAYPEENGIAIVIYYSLINNPESLSFTFILKRVR
jgi:phage baseplate assembly protein W